MMLYDHVAVHRPGRPGKLDYIVPPMPSPRRVRLCQRSGCLPMVMRREVYGPGHEYGAAYCPRCHRVGLYWPIRIPRYLEAP